MNAEQRKKVAACQLAISNQCKELEQIRDENQDSLDNMPEDLQSDDEGSDIEQAIEWLTEAVDNLENVDSLLSNF